MIRRGNENTVGGKIVKLQEKRCHDPLDFTSLVKIATFFANGVEFVEEKDAGFGSHIIEEPP